MTPCKILHWRSPSLFSTGVSVHTHLLAYRAFLLPLFRPSSSPSMCFRSAAELTEPRPQVDLWVWVCRVSHCFIVVVLEDEEEEEEGDPVYIMGVHLYGEQQYQTVAACLCTYITYVGQVHYTDNGCHGNRPSNMTAISGRDHPVALTPLVSSHLMGSQL